MAERKPTWDADRDLVARVATGDVAAMQSLYTLHAEAARRFVRGRINDAQAAEDVVHDTMLAVWRGAGGFEGRASVRSWILTLARNKAVDHVRRHAKVTLAEPDETIPDDSPDPASVIAASQDADRLRACLHGLPERMRAAVHLAFFEDLTCAEIARIEDVPEGTIKTRIHHAKKKLMACLAG